MITRIIIAFLLVSANAFAEDNECSNIETVEEILAKDYSEQEAAVNQYWSEAFDKAPVAEPYKPLPSGWLRQSKLNAVANCYLNGVGVNQDIGEAAYYFSHSANLGNAQAAHTLASLLLFYSDDPTEQQKGLNQLSKEVSEGSSFSAGKLGQAYLLGIVVQQNISKALELFEQAAQGGNTHWQFLLSHAYQMGYLGLTKSAEKSEYWKNLEPKIHRLSYNCEIYNLYQDGTFPRANWSKVQHEYPCQ